MLQNEHLEHEHDVERRSTDVSVEGDIDLDDDTDIIVVGTLGRSAWILDDLTPVREMTTEIATSALHLFAPRTAIRWHYAGEPYGRAAGSGSNPNRSIISTRPTCNC